MKDTHHFDVIIIGGSYSGLAAGMALGRALKNILIIDDRKPCNRQTPHSHNFLTRDGQAPGDIAAIGREQVEKYETVTFFNGLASSGRKTENGFEIRVTSGEIYSAAKLIFATGIKDILPDLEGLDECWGISVLHCPYCHGYEVRNQKTGILGNGDYAYDFAILISNWTKDLTIFTNGHSTLGSDRAEKLKSHGIDIIEMPIAKLEHYQGYLEHVLLADGSRISLKAMYTHCSFEQHCPIPLQLGCNLTEEGYIKTDPSQKTSVDGIYACGDNASRLRTVANAVATGTTAGIMVSKEIVIEQF